MTESSESTHSDLRISSQFRKISSMTTWKEVIERFIEIIQQMEGFIKADGSQLFVIQSDFLYKIDKDSNEIDFLEKYPLETQSIVAVHTANILKPSIVTRVDDPYPKGIGNDNFSIVLSIPVISTENKGIAVFDFYKKNVDFSEVQVTTAKCMLAWLGRNIMPPNTELIQYNGLCRYWIRNFRKIIHQEITLDQFISKNLKQLQKATKASAINFYKCLQLSTNLIMFGQVKEGCFLKASQEFQLESNTVLKTVLKEKCPIQFDNASIDEFKERHGVSFLPGGMLFRIVSYLCVPINSASLTLGLVELINKKQEKSFNEFDKKLAVICGRFCCFGTSLERSVNRKNIMHEKRIINEKVLMYHVTTCSHSLKKFLEKLPEIEIPDKFDSFDYYPSLKQLDFLEYYSWFIFKDVFNLNNISDPRSQKFINFVLCVKKCYRNISFHNFEHGTAVCHSIYMMSRSNKHIFTPLEIKGLIVASLCHDLDHPGITNKFIELTKNPLSVLFKQSYLENYHSFLTRKLIQETGIFNNLPNEEYKFLLKFINKAILHTDLFVYFINRIKVTYLLNSGKLCLENKKHKNYVIGIAMTSADLSGQCKGFAVATRLCRNLYKELNLQEQRVESGEKSAKAKEEVAKNVPKFQKQFNEEICLPVFSLLNEVLLGVGALYENCLVITKIWHEMCENHESWDPYAEEFAYSDVNTASLDELLQSCLQSAQKMSKEHKKCTSSIPVQASDSIFNAQEQD